ncbi:N-acetylmuramoyl-L-alanine amidase family protein [Schwartzia sp. (in: firmicutes)]
MRDVVCRFLLTLLLCVFMIPGEVEAAPSHEIKYITSKVVEEDGNTFLRMEIGLSKGAAEYTVKNGSILHPNRLCIEIENTKPGDVQKEMRLDPKYAKSARVRGLDKNTQVLFSLAGLAENEEYSITTIEADKKHKKPFRIVVDIYESGYVRRGFVDGLKGRHIVVDPGHGGTDRGATGPSGLLEKDVTLEVSLKLRDILENSGAIVTLTREDDRDVWGPTATDSQELQARSDVGENTPGTEVFLSVHCNAFSSASSHGTETYYYYGKSWLDELLAQNLQEAMLEHNGLHDRGVKATRFYVLTHTSMPAALVELAFITNYEEEALLGDDAFQEEMAMALAEGLANYFAGSGT